MAGRTRTQPPGELLGHYPPSLARLAPDDGGSRWRPVPNPRARRNRWLLQPAEGAGDLASHWPTARDQANWRDQAACRDLPTEFFFPVGHGSLARAQAEVAKAVCQDCPVRSDCLLFSMVTNAEYGVFGGLSEDERRALRRRLGPSYDAGQLEETA